VSVKEKRVRFRSIDGILLRGVLTIPDQEAKGAVILAHGITGEKEEGGFYTRLAKVLAEKGLASLRFDFRGHEESGGKTWEVTIKGELNDLSAAVRLLRSRGYKRFALVGFSFGGGIVVLYTKRRPRGISSLTLLCSVLDYKRTFLEPETQKGREWFTKEALAAAKRTGRLNLAGFILGHGLLQEFRRYDPGENLLRLDVPALVVHGTEDDMVPYSVARYYGRKYKRGTFLSLKADHCFKKFEKELFPKISDWILKHMDRRWT